jgi:hypothetical protein
MGSEKAAALIMRAAERKLKAAEFGLEDMVNRPDERLETGFYNAIVFGRMATLTLQNLENRAAGFEKWYSTEKLKMKTNPTLQYCYELRTSIEKQVGPPTYSGTSLAFSSPDWQKYFEPKPPGAIRIFVSDPEGRSGWIVRDALGEEASYYVRFPDGAPIPLLRKEGGRPNVKAVRLATEYLSYMRSLLQNARSRFVYD